MNDLKMVYVTLPKGQEEKQLKIHFRAMQGESWKEIEAKKKTPSLLEIKKVVHHLSKHHLDRAAVSV